MVPCRSSPSHRAGPAPVRKSGASATPSSTQKQQSLLTFFNKQPSKDAPVDSEEPELPSPAPRKFLNTKVNAAPITPQASSDPAAERSSPPLGDSQSSEKENARKGKTLINGTSGDYLLFYLRMVFDSFSVRASFESRDDVESVD